MKPLKSVDELRRLQKELAVCPAGDVVMRICSTGCQALGAREVCDALERQIARRGLGERAHVVTTGCHGLCSGAVTMVIDPQGIYYQGVTPDDAPEIIDKTVVGGAVIDRLCWSCEGRTASCQKDIPFYRQQTRLILRNCGLVDPRSIEDAIARGGYSTAARVLSTMSPDQVIAEVQASELRGRGGAGFPTGRKWQFARSAKGEPKYIICNADEGDPGTFMDRALLEGDPHLLIEGMLIGAYAVGAAKGFNYIRAEYPIAIETTEIALAQAREAGLLGKNILGTGFDFDIEVIEGAGSYVCGEETALIASIEGARGMPHVRPPFPANCGLHGKPTNVNNVETWANVPRVFEMGAEAFAAIGTERSKGTKILSLAGAVTNAGLVEVPMGVTLRHVIFDIGGGVAEGGRFKAAQIGGPCGGCVPEEYLDLPVDYDSLQQIGAMMGCGGIIVLDHNTCMVELARMLAEFARSESCGQCVPCRVGTKRMVEILDRITTGHGRLEDIDRLEELGGLIHEASLCGMAPDPVPSSVRHFRGEYEAHVIEKRCPSGRCAGVAAARGTGQ